MAAYDIQRHFSGLRVQTARRRKDPFAETFDDDSEDEGRKSRTKTKAPPVAKPASAPNKTSVASPFASIDALRDSDDDFLDVPTQQKRTHNRRPSPAPAKLAAQRVIDGAGRRGSLPGALPSTDPKKAAVLAAGPLAYLDDSSDDEPLVPPSRKDRSSSPAPRKGSNDPTGRSQTPKGDKLATKDQSPKNNIVPPKHTVASPFAGTKYLQDSDSDEEAVSSRKNSADSAASPERKDNDSKKKLEVKRVDKPKQNGSGVSWRAFSASRAEQRYAEVEALQASLRQRGRTISFCPHVTTDDGKRIPLSATSERGPGPKGRARGKSPPRRTEDTKPDRDEVADRPSSGGGGPVDIYDPVEFKTNPFTGEPVRRSNSDDPSSNIKRPGPVNNSLPDIRIDDISQQ